MLVDCYRDLVETVRSATYRNARVGQAFALFGLLAFLVGYGLFLAGESLNCHFENESVTGFVWGRSPDR